MASSPRPHNRGRGVPLYAHASPRATTHARDAKMGEGDRADGPPRSTQSKGISHIIKFFNAEAKKNTITVPHCTPTKKALGRSVIPPTLPASTPPPKLTARSPEVNSGRRDPVRASPQSNIAVVKCTQKPMTKCFKLNEDMRFLRSSKKSLGNPIRSSGQRPAPPAFVPSTTTHSHASLFPSFQAKLQLFSSVEKKGNTAKPAFLGFARAPRTPHHISLSKEPTTRAEHQSDGYESTNCVTDSVAQSSSSSVVPSPEMSSAMKRPSSSVAPSVTRTSDVLMPSERICTKFVPSDFDKYIPVLPQCASTYALLSTPDTLLEQPMLVKSDNLRLSLSTQGDADCEQPASIVSTRGVTAPLSPKRDVTREQPVPLSPKSDLIVPLSPKRNFTHDLTAPLSPKRDVAAPLSPKRDTISGQPVPLSPKSDLVVPLSPKRNFTHDSNAPLSPKRDVAAPLSPKCDTISGQPVPCMSPSAIPHPSSPKGDAISPLSPKRAVPPMQVRDLRSPSPSRTSTSPSDTPLACHVTPDADSGTPVSHSEVRVLCSRVHDSPFSKMSPQNDGRHNKMRNENTECGRYARAEPSSEKNAEPPMRLSQSSGYGDDIYVGTEDVLHAKQCDESVAMARVCGTSVPKTGADHLAEETVLSLEQKLKQPVAMRPQTLSPKQPKVNDDSVHAAKEHIQAPLPKQPKANDDKVAAAEEHVQTPLPKQPKANDDSVNAVKEDIQTPSPKQSKANDDGVADAEEHVLTPLPKLPKMNDDGVAGAEEHDQTSSPQQPKASDDSVAAAEEHAQTSSPKQPKASDDSVAAAEEHIRTPLPKQPKANDNGAADAEEHVQTSSPKQPKANDDSVAASEEHMSLSPKPPKANNSVAAAEEHIRTPLPKQPKANDDGAACAEEHVQTSSPKKPKANDDSVAAAEEHMSLSPKPPKANNGVAAAEEHIRTPLPKQPKANDDGAAGAEEHVQTSSPKQPKANDDSVAAAEEHMSLSPKQPKANDDSVAGANKNKQAFSPKQPKAKDEGVAATEERAQALSPKQPEANDDGVAAAKEHTQILSPKQPKASDDSVNVVKGGIQTPSPKQSKANDDGVAAAEEHIRTPLPKQPKANDDGAAGAEEHVQTSSPKQPKANDDSVAAAEEHMSLSPKPPKANDDSVAGANRNKEAFSPKQPKAEDESVAAAEERIQALPPKQPKANDDGVAAEEHDTVQPRRPSCERHNFSTQAYQRSESNGKLVLANKKRGKVPASASRLPAFVAQCKDTHTAASAKTRSEIIADSIARLHPAHHVGPSRMARRAASEKRSAQGPSGSGTAGTLFRNCSSLPQEKTRHGMGSRAALKTANNKKKAAKPSADVPATKETLPVCQAQHDMASRPPWNSNTSIARHDSPFKPWYISDVPLRCPGFFKGAASSCNPHNPPMSSSSKEPSSEQITSSNPPASLNDAPNDDQTSSSNLPRSSSSNAFNANQTVSSNLPESSSCNAPNADQALISNVPESSSYNAPNADQILSSNLPESSSYNAPTADQILSSNLPESSSSNAPTANQTLSSNPPESSSSNAPNTVHISSFNQPTKVPGTKNLSARGFSPFKPPHFLSHVASPSKEPAPCDGVLPSSTTPLLGARAPAIKGLASCLQVPCSFKETAPRAPAFPYAAPTLSKARLRPPVIPLFSQKAAGSNCLQHTVDSKQRLNTTNNQPQSVAVDVPKAATNTTLPQSAFPRAELSSIASKKRTGLFRSLFQTFQIGADRNKLRSNKTPATEKHPKDHTVAQHDDAEAARCINNGATSSETEGVSQDLRTEAERNVLPSDETPAIQRHANGHRASQRDNAEAEQCINNGMSSQRVIDASSQNADPADSSNGIDAPYVPDVFPRPRPGMAPKENVKATPALKTKLQKLRKIVAALPRDPRDCFGLPEVSQGANQQSIDPVWATNAYEEIRRQEHIDPDSIFFPSIPTVDTEEVWGMNEVQAAMAAGISCEPPPSPSSWIPDRLRPDEIKEYNRLTGKTMDWEIPDPEAFLVRLSRDRRRQHRNRDSVV